MTLNDIRSEKRPLHLTSTAESSTAGSGVHIESRGARHQKYMNASSSSHIASSAIFSSKNETAEIMMKTRGNYSHFAFQKKGSSVDDTMVGTKEAKAHARRLVIPDKSAFALDLNLVPSQHALTSHNLNVRKASSASKAKASNNVHAHSSTYMHHNGGGGTNFTTTTVEKKRSNSDVVERISVNLLVSEPGSPAAKAIDVTNEFAVVTRRGPKYIKSPTVSFKKPAGNEIHDQHEQYTLTYGMMTGILQSAGTSNMFKLHLNLRDFMRIDKRNFPANPKSKLKHAFKFKDYAPDIFRQIRQRFDIDSADYLVTLCGDFNYIEFMSNSKSGQFFFYSHDGRFMIKTQTKGESKFLRRILPHYYQFVMENPNTLITRFYGMHRVKMAHLKTEMHFVIMASVFSTPKEIHLRFDLKGSKVGRSATVKDKANKNGVLKDNDLLQEKIHISLGQEKRAMMLEQLRKDVAFLKRMKIMDYSLLIGIHDSRQEILATAAADDDALAVLPYENENHERETHR